MILRATITALAFVAISVPSLALGEESAQYKELFKPFLQRKQNDHRSGNRLSVRHARNHGRITEVAAGTETGWHEHPVPLFIYVMEGELTIDYGEKGIKVVKAGEGILEAINWPHNGINKTDAPVKIVAFYMGSDSLPNTEVPDSP